MSILPVCVYITCMPYVPGDQERKSDSLELELWMVVGHHGVLIYGKNGVINFKVVEEIFY